MFSLSDLERRIKRISEHCTALRFPTFVTCSYISACTSMQYESKVYCLSNFCGCYMINAEPVHTQCMYAQADLSQMSKDWFENNRTEFLDHIDKCRLNF